MNEDQSQKNEKCFEAILETLTKLRQSKPDDRSEQARRYAVIITEMEKVMSYFNTMIIEEESR